MIEEQEAKVKEKAFEFNAPYRSVYRELFCTDLSNSSASGSRPRRRSRDVRTRNHSRSVQASVSSQV